MKDKMNKGEIYKKRRAVGSGGPMKKIVKGQRHRIKDGQGEYDIVILREKQLETNYNALVYYMSFSDRRHTSALSEATLEKALQLKVRYEK